MWNIISYIKEIIIWSLPIYFLHLYIKSIYQVSLGQLIIWWGKNYTSTESSTAILITFLLIFLLFSLPLTSLVNSFYLGLFGTKQSLIYLGNSSANKSMYFKHFDTRKSPFAGFNIDNKYNYSFADLNKVKYFIKDPGTENIVGQKNKRLHPTAIISTFFFMTFLLFPALGVIHALIYPMYIDINGDNAVLHGEVVKSFELVLLKFKISKGLSALILFSSLIMALYFSKQMPDEANRTAVTPLPAHIKANETISSYPVEINIAYEEITRDDGTKTQVDSGFRDTIFRFDQGFEPSVYVTLNFDTREYPLLVDEITSHISDKKEMSLRLDEKLQLQPAYKLKLE